MAEDLIRYDILAQDALRGVVRKVLSEVAKTGLPGNHHFYVTFATRAVGVRISSRLLAQYPEDMTIVLQHQYWDLTANEHAFEVGLSFNGVSERLLVPFTAIRAFVDPSVPFSLQFQLPAAEDASAPTRIVDAAIAMVEGPKAPAADIVAEKRPVDGQAEVVSLDAFRKKH